ncbi:MAG: hypothetical protein ACYC5M_18655 [Anaerolineae bacterium]
MNEHTERGLALALLARHGRTLAEELGIPLSPDNPSALFRLLVASLLFGAPVSAGAAGQAAFALSDYGWTDAHTMSRSTWEERVRILRQAGFSRHDESTSRLLDQLVQRLLERYDGDLASLREEAGRDPDRERKLLRELTGGGEESIAVFLREAQAIWEELYPFADETALEGARELGLPADARALAGLVSRTEYPRLAAGLARVRWEGTAEELRAAVDGL